MNRCDTQVDASPFILIREDRPITSTHLLGDMARYRAKGIVACLDSPLEVFLVHQKQKHGGGVVSREVAE